MKKICKDDRYWSQLTYIAYVRKWILNSRSERKMYLMLDQWKIKFTANKFPYEDQLQSEPV